MEKMVKVKGKANVTCSGYFILPGVITEVPEDVAVALGSSVEIIGKVEAKAVEAPVVDKMIKVAPKAKGKRARKTA